jgi:hypothetical protein
MTLDDFNLKEFLEDLDLYGGDLATWPAAKKVDADKVLQKSAQARAELAAMRQAEAVLSATRVTHIVNGQSIAACAMRARQERPVTVAIRRTSWLVAGSAALVLGIVAGILPFSERPSDVLGAALDQVSGSDVQ